MKEPYSQGGASFLLPNEDDEILSLCELIHVCEFMKRTWRFSAWLHEPRCVVLVGAVDEIAARRGFLGTHPTKRGCVALFKNPCFSGSKISHPILYILIVEYIYIEAYVTYATYMTMI